MPEKVPTRPPIWCEVLLALRLSLAVTLPLAVLAVMLDPVK